MSFSRFSSAPRRRKRLEKRRVRSWFFLALDRTAASTNRTLNLYRYFRSSNQTFSNMISGSLFTNVATGAAGEELLARNVVGLKITPVSSGGGDWIPFAPTPEAPLPEIIEITLVTIGHDVAQKAGRSRQVDRHEFPSHEAGRAKLHHASQRGKEAVRRRGSKAASLITTLLVIVVLSTVVVAFMQSTSIDRLTAKSAKNVLQAELSARAGLQSAISQLLAAAGTNNGFVTGSTNFSTEQRSGGRNWPNQPFRSATDHAFGVDCSAPPGDLSAKRMDRFALHFVRRYGGNQQHGRQRPLGNYPEHEYFVSRSLGGNIQ